MASAASPLASILVDATLLPTFNCPAHSGCWLRWAMLVSGRLVLLCFVRTIHLASHPTWDWAVPVAGCREIVSRSCREARLASPKPWAPRLGHGFFRRWRFLQPSRHVETKAKWLPDQVVYSGCSEKSELFLLCRPRIWATVYAGRRRNG